MNYVQLANFVVLLLSLPSAIKVLQDCDPDLLLTREPQEMKIGIPVEIVCLPTDHDAPVVVITTLRKSTILHFFQFQHNQ